MTTPHEESRLDADTLVKAAREALTRPSDFGYHGDLDLFGSLGFTFGQNRDSDCLDRSNYRIALRLLTATAAGEVHCPALPSTDRCASCGRDYATLGREQYRWPRHTQPPTADPDETVQEVRCSHWAHGWADHLAVRVLTDPDGPVDADNLTAVFIQAVELVLSLQDYPALSDEDVSELETEEFDAYFDIEWSAMLRNWDTDQDGPEPTEEDSDAVRSNIRDDCDGLDGWGDLADRVKTHRTA